MKNIKGIIFDYGGTIDSNGKHWFQVLWQTFRTLGYPVTEEQYKQAYIHGERTLARTPLIKPQYNYYDVLRCKYTIQFDYLIQNKNLPKREYTTQILQISEKSYLFAKQSVDNARPILQALHERYPMVLVSNFYGNITKVLEDFKVQSYFNAIVESSVVGIRKPDPAIFALGVHKLGWQPAQIAVIGDSFSKDIYPASLIGCKTIWLKGEGWDENVDTTLPTVIIDDFGKLREVFNIY